MSVDDVLALAGRLLLAAIFLASAFGKITNFPGTVALMEAQGVPLAPLLCAAAAVVESLGAIALMLGFQTRLGAAALAGVLVAATWVFHLGADQRVHLLKNLAILGGLLQVLAFGAGSWSFEGRRRS